MGLIISWRWDLIGGILSISGLLVTVIFRPDLFFMALVLSIPADLFILYWYFAKKQLEKA
jgi:hypothetical protein